MNYRIIRRKLCNGTYVNITETPIGSIMENRTLIIRARMTNGKEHDFGCYLSCNPMESFTEMINILQVYGVINKTVNTEGLPNKLMEIVSEYLVFKLEDIGDTLGIVSYLGSRKLSTYEKYMHLIHAIMYIKCVVYKGESEKQFKNMLSNSAQVQNGMHYVNIKGRKKLAQVYTTKYNISVLQTKDFVYIMRSQELIKRVCS